ncbi:thioredoxin domain-containing protein [Gluconacetobacter takamatsuzukensis]|uniref:Peroxiredoxin n=1 Tax=Gluconacetobacter takamatsuzukensis TaxID=1286190 RepID=A0A7W4PRB9_9PROT|nr:peroxiredoxin [Gluconacetobacter takamatsuzukensis]MBB2205329.1 peroxiredoxin [Gluconacetobacter takamatsuzukensis]
MTLFPGWQAPDFTAETNAGPIHFHAWQQGSWGIVITHPADYDLDGLRRAGAWALSRSQPVRLLGLSPAHDDDSPYGPGFTMVTQQDATRVARAWQGVTVDIGDIIPEAPTAERAVYIIGPDLTIRTTLSHPPARGRQFTDIIQTAEALGLEDIPLRPVRAA